MFIRKIKSFTGLLLGFSYDLIRYWKYASNNRKPSQNANCMIAHIWMSTHAIEKGLSMISPRKGFGKNVVERLVVLLRDYKSRGFEENEAAISSALGALDQYLLWHDANSSQLGELEGKIRNVLVSFNVQRSGGITRLYRANICEAAKEDFHRLAASRHSIRQFTSEPVNMTTIREAVCLAQRTPSVCNRQSSRVYVCSDNSKIARLAQLQGGCRGFGETAPCFIIITSDLASFTTSAERKQAYIDGGLFSMSLIYALHYLGLATCPLNWCKNYSADRKIRQEFKLNASEDIVLLLAVGDMPDEFSVPQSNREELDKIMKVI